MHQQSLYNPFVVSMSYRRSSFDRSPFDKLRMNGFFLNVLSKGQRQVQGEREE